MSSPNKFSAYLTPYRAKQIDHVGDFPGKKGWDSVVCVPLYAEGTGFLPLLESLKRSATHSQRKILGIFVLNAKDSDEEPFRASNEKSRDFFGKLLKPLTPDSPAYFGEYCDGVDLLLLDLSLPPHLFPHTEGVGLARKIASDLALRLYGEGKVSDAWIRSTDADATLPLDYFQTLPKTPGTVVFPFRHDTENNPALLLYELYLRHHVLGLRKAGSPYAYTPLGSAVAMHAEIYTAIRGFPKRLAAEDFYLLNKAAKIAPVWEGLGTPILLADRPSARIPFGTGPAVAKIGSDLSTPLFYNEKSYEVLKAWLSEAERVCHLPSLPNLGAFWSTEIGKLAEATQGRAALEEAFRTRKTAKDRLRHFHTQFDALRTLKFLHAFRDTGYPKLKWSDIYSGDLKEINREVGENFYQEIWSGGIVRTKELL